MRTMDKWTVLLYVALGLLVAVVLLQYAPVCAKVPGRDAGVFLYVGDQVLNGGIPYLDVWDHKPPVIYFINAFGLLVGGGSVWGVWLLEFLALYSAALVGFVLMRRAFGVLPAVVATVVWVLSIGLLHTYGNLTEEFALPLIFAVLYLFWEAEKRGSYHWRGFLIGALAAVCFLLKPNVVSVPLSIGILLLIAFGSRRWRSAAANLSTVVLGAACVVAAVLVYLAANNALSAFVEQVVRYNLVYPTTTLYSKLDSLFVGLSALSRSGLAVIGLAAWVAGVLLVWRRREDVQSVKPLLYVCLIALPLEFLLTAILGRPYTHYYYAWLPVLAVLVAFFCYYVMTGFAPAVKAFKVGRVVVTLGGLWLLAFLVAMSFQPATSIVHRTAACIADAGGEGCHSTWCQAVEYVTEQTEEGDYVLVWGAEASVNFLAHRQAPTRYVYQYPLYHPRYTNEDIADEFLGDIMLNKPALIIDTSPTNGAVPPIDSGAREEWASTHTLRWMDDVFEYIASEYEAVATVGAGRWVVYRYTGEDAADH